jgi:hypothetical protein
MRRQETAGQGFTHKTIKARKLPAYPLFTGIQENCQPAFFINKKQTFPACLL